MSDETHEGWTNRETWAVAYHINDDKRWQTQVLTALQTAGLAQPYDDYRSDDQPNAFGIPDRLTPDEYRAVLKHRAAAVIQENVEDIFDGLLLHGDKNLAETAVIIRDIGSLWRVNWAELGTEFLRKLAES